MRQGSHPATFPPCPSACDGQTFQEGKPALRQVSGSRGKLGTFKTAARVDFYPHDHKGGGLIRTSIKSWLRNPISSDISNRFFPRSFWALVVFYTSPTFTRLDPAPGPYSAAVCPLALTYTPPVFHYQLPTLSVLRCHLDSQASDRR